MSNQPLALEYHGKSQAEGHWRRGQELIDALAYIDPLTPDVKQQVDKLVEEEMRRSTKRPADYLKEMPAIRPARFEGHPMLQQEYERVRAKQPMEQLDVTRYRLDPPPANKKNDHAAWVAAANNAHAQLEHQLNRITNLELLVKYGANAWRAQSVFDEAVLKQLEGTLQGLRKSIDQLNRERKLQQQTAGAELRVLEDKYYSALRKNLEISAACQAVQEEMELLEAKMGKIGDKLARERQQEEQQQEQEQRVGNGEAAAAAAAAAATENGVASEEQQQGQEQDHAQQQKESAQAQRVQQMEAEAAQAQQPAEAEDAPQEQQQQQQHPSADANEEGPADMEQ